MVNMKELAARLKDNISLVMVGKEDTSELMLTALIASGHVLLEDVPGTGKTKLAKTLAQSLDCSFQRIQFTPDLLPSDLTGIHFFNQKEGDFVFRPGPLFANFVLADEINRATPRTQASLLECMEERQISVDGETMKLERPFMVIATQNPIDNQGTFPLPEAQMDRFMMKISMGYPIEHEGVEILKRTALTASQQVAAVISREEIIEAQQQYRNVRIHDDLLRYIIHIAEATRAHRDIQLGVSPRGAQALMNAVQSYAAIQGRDYVLPDDIKYMAPYVLAHRLVFKNRLRQGEDRGLAVVSEVLENVAVPTEEALDGGGR